MRLAPSQRRTAGPKKLLVVLLFPPSSLCPSSLWSGSGVLASMFEFGSRIAISVCSSSLPVSALCCLCLCTMTMRMTCTYDCTVLCTVHLCTVTATVHCTLLAAWLFWCSDDRTTTSISFDILSIKWNFVRGSFVRSFVRWCPPFLFFGSADFFLKIISTFESAKVDSALALLQVALLNLRCLEHYCCCLSH